MLPEIERPLDGLERRRRALLAELAGLSEEQLSFRPGPGQWSPLQVAQHLMIAESGAVGAIERRPVGRRARRSPRQNLFKAAVWVVLRFGFRVRTPSRRLDPDGELTLAELETAWSEAGRRLRASLEEVTLEELHHEAFRHPVSGPLDFAAGLAFLNAHFDHHLRQLGRIRGAPGYPAAAIAVGGSS